MDFNVCAQCGAEIESKGIHFRSKVFCSDECCEVFEAAAAEKIEPVIDELVDDDLVPDEDEALGYRDGDDDADPLDDDFDINPGDF